MMEQELIEIPNSETRRKKTYPKKGLGQGVFLQPSCRKVEKAGQERK